MQGVYQGISQTKRGMHRASLYLGGGHHHHAIMCMHTTIKVHKVGSGVKFACTQYLTAHAHSITSKLRRRLLLGLCSAATHALASLGCSRQCTLSACRSGVCTIAPPLLHERLVLVDWRGAAGACWAHARGQAIKRLLTEPEPLILQ